MTVKPFPAHLPVTVATYQKSVGYSSGSQLNEVCNNDQLIVSCCVLDFASTGGLLILN